MYCKHCRACFVFYVVLVLPCSEKRLQKGGEEGKNNQKGAVAYCLPKQIDLTVILGQPHRHTSTLFRRKIQMSRVLFPQIFVYCYAGMFYSCFHTQYGLFAQKQVNVVNCLSLYAFSLLLRPETIVTNSNSDGQSAL